MEAHDPLPPSVEILVSQVVDSAFKIHTQLGPGLLESIYELCLAHELRRRGIEVDCQVPVDIVYEGCRFDGGLRLDMLVQNEVIVEVKASERQLPVHRAQLLTYLKLAGKRIGLLINFNVALIKDGITRIRR